MYRNLDQTCCFTGHRPDRLPWLLSSTDIRTKALQNALWQRICKSYDEGYRFFLSGMARGVDLLCAQLVLQLQMEDSAVQLIPILPFPGQSNNWSPAEKQIHKRVLDYCSQPPVIVSSVYHRGCYNARNRYMVDHSSKVIAVYDGTPSGGTFQTLEYARKQGCQIEMLVPD